MKKDTGGFIEFPSNIEEAHSFDDCMLIKCSTYYYLMIPFRDGFLKHRIKKKKFFEIKNNIVVK